MKARYEDIASKLGSDSYLAYAFTVPAFEFKWHYHPEYELTLISSGNGKRIVGDNYSNFEAGDLVLIGPGLPHTWSSTPKKKREVSAVVIQFSEDFIGNFLPLNEFKAVADLVNHSSRGIYFPSAANLYDALVQLPTLSGVERITSLFNILQSLSQLHYEKLSSSYFNAIKGEETENRINKVCRFVLQHSTMHFTLEEAANLIHLSKSAFSKFFKRATGKTFSDYVNEIRVGNACQLLIESDKTVGEISFESGFESLTYFNRVFRKKKGCTPRDFRKR